MNTDLSRVLDELKDQLAKAAVTNSIYAFSPASRSIFAPENLDPIIKLLPPTQTPVRSMLPRTKGYGQAAAWKKLTSQLNPRNPNVGSVAGTNTAGSFADAGTPNSTTQTFTVATAAYKNIGRDVEVGRQAIASSRGYQDIRDELVRLKTFEVMLCEEDYILNGDTAIDALGFDGFASLITTNSGSLSLLSASGIGNQIQSAYWNWGATPEFVIANPRQIRALADDLQGSGSIQRIAIDQQGAAIGGVALAKIVNPIDGTLMDVIASRYAAGNAYIIDVYDPSGQAWIEMEDLESMSVYEPPTSTHSVISRVFETTVLKMMAEQKQIKLTGLATS